MDKTETVNPLATAVVSAGTVSAPCHGNNEKAPIVGTWRETSFEYEEFVNNVSQGVINSGTINEFEATTIIFNGDGTFTEYCVEILVTGTYSINGDVLSITYESNNDTSKLVFTVKNSQLTVVYTQESRNKNNDMVKCTTTTILNKP